MGKTWYDRTKKVISWDLLKSDEWRLLVSNFEGLRLEAYQDSVGVWTIGYGSTGSHVKPGMRITKEEAEKLLDEDAARFEDAVNDLVEVGMTQYQFDALVSFCFNLGQGALGKSTLLDKLNDEDYDGAAQEFDRWVYAGGKKLRGLVRRRKGERLMFEGKNWKRVL